MCSAANNLNSMLSKPISLIGMRARVGVLVATCLFVAACGDKEAVEDPIAISVNGLQIRLSQLQGQLDSISGTGAPIQRNQQSFIDDYVSRQVALTKARELGLDQDPALLRQWENLLIGRLQQTTLTAALANVSVADDAVQAYYEANVAEYTKGTQIRAALLRLEIGSHVDQNQRASMRAKMEEARRLAAALPAGAKGFGALAMRYSDEGTSRFKGGDIGWMQAGLSSDRWPETVQVALFQLRPSAPYSEVIETSDAVYLVKYLDHRSEVVRPLSAELRNSIQRTLYAQARQDVKASLHAQWSDDSHVVIHPDVINQLNFSQNELITAQRVVTHLPASPLQ